MFKNTLILTEHKIHIINYLITKYNHPFSSTTISIFSRLSSSTGQNAKTPLVVVTLYIPPDIQTLAPKEIKRDPRKQPSYCQNFKSSSSFEKGRSSPEFFIKGYEIIDKSSVSTDVEATVVDHETEDDGKNERNDTCCTCMVDDERYNNSTDDDCTLMTQNELLLNFDDYEMDAYGHLPGDSRTPTPTPIRKYIDGKSRCRITALRASSPSTGQVIRVTMNNKNQKRR